MARLWTTDKLSEFSGVFFRVFFWICVEYFSGFFNQTEVRSPHWGPFFLGLISIFPSFPGYFSELSTIWPIRPTNHSPITISDPPNLNFHPQYSVLMLIAFWPLSCNFFTRNASFTRTTRFTWVTRFTDSSESPNLPESVNSPDSPESPESLESPASTES